MNGSTERARAGRFLLPAAVLAACLFCLTPVSNPDLPWHLSIGAWLLEHRTAPTVDFLSWTAPGTPWVDPEWGTQLL